MRSAGTGTLVASHPCADSYRPGSGTLAGLVYRTNRRQRHCCRYSRWICRVRLAVPGAGAARQSLRYEPCTSLNCSFLNGSHRVICRILADGITMAATSTDLTRQQLDELDVLLQRMLALPLNSSELK